MALTMGTGPFGRSSAGQFNFSADGPAHVLYWEDNPKRVRAMFADETVADSREVKLLHETGLPPVCYFPLVDVREDLLEGSDHTTHCPFKGDAAYWSVRVGDRVAENAVWGYPHPLPHAPPLAGYAAFYREAMDAWYEEGEQVHGHARDPYHRIDVLDGGEPVTVRLHGTVVAASDRPRWLFETGLPPRCYVPRADVHAELTASETRTRCPYKGLASYWSVRADGRLHTDAAFGYPDPHPEAARIAGHVCILDEGATIQRETA